MQRFPAKFSVSSEIASIFQIKRKLHGVTLTSRTGEKKYLIWMEKRLQLSCLNTQTDSNGKLIVIQCMMYEQVSYKVEELLNCVGLV